MTLRRSMPFWGRKVESAPVGPPTITTFGSLGGGNKYIGGALGANGKIYCAPYDATRVLEIDPSTDSTALIGTTYASGGAKWHGCILAPNGCIYCAPFNATQVLKINPLTGVTSLIGSTYSGSYKWSAAILANNGKIYCTPSAATQVLEIDPATDTTTVFGSLGSGFKWYGGALAEDGNIYGVRFSSPSGTVLKIDPSGPTASTFAGSGFGSQWVGGSLANDGNLYGCRFNANVYNKIDYRVPNETTVPGPAISPASSSFFGSVLGPNGKIYSSPHTATLLEELDPAGPTVTQYGSLTGSSKWAGIVLAPNGFLYGIPYASASILKIGNVGSVSSGMYTIPSPISGLSSSIYNRHQNKF